MTVHYGNVKVDIEYMNYSKPYYRCRLFWCSELQHEWKCRWRWMADWSAKSKLRQFKNGVRWKAKPPKNAKKWTVR